jgi:hypothetical protein
LSWLNDPENKYLTKHKRFNKYDQEEWYRSLSSRNDYLIWGVKYKSIPIGAAGLKKIDKDSAHVFWYMVKKNIGGEI